MDDDNDEITSEIPIRALSRFCNPFERTCWEIDRPITYAEVAKAIADYRFCDYAGGGQFPHSRDWHIGRVAFFVENGWPDPISLDVGVPSIGVPRPSWMVDDGNHRLSAAIFMGHRTITGSIGGSLEHSYRLGLNPAGRIQNELGLAMEFLKRRMGDHVLIFRDDEGIISELLPVTLDGNSVMTMIHDAGIHDINEIVMNRLTGDEGMPPIHGCGTTCENMPTEEFLLEYLKKNDVSPDHLQKEQTRCASFLDRIIHARNLSIPTSGKRITPEDIRPRTASPTIPSP